MKTLLVLIFLYLLLIVGLFCLSARKFYSVSAPLWSRSDLCTATRKYSDEDTTGQNKEYIECKYNCSWDNWLDNQEFKATVAYRSPFDMEDDQEVAGMKETLACVPFTFGYSKGKGEEVFPPRDYPSCASLVRNPLPELHLDPDSGLFSMKCPDNTPGKYVVKPSSVPPTSFNLYNDLLPLWTENTSSSNDTVPIEESEFVFGACGQQGYSDAQLIPKFNREAWHRASQILAEKPHFKRPIIILFLAVDSFSRHHFFRKMPQTVAYFNSLNQGGKHTVFDFKLHNIMGRSSPENMVPMFSNATLEERMEPQDRDVLGDTALWAILKKWGFVVTTGFENCGSDFLNFIGRKQNVDHFVNAFYCAAKRFMGVSTDKAEVNQRCIGPRMSHSYMFNYTSAVSRLYAGLNQFFYFHIDTAHEQSGQHAILLDTDLRDFLREYLEEMSRNSDVVVFIQADHGMRYGPWHVDLEAEQEFKLPALFVLTQTQFLDKLPKSYDSLWHNTFRLISKRDLRATILALAGVPFGETYPVKTESYLQDSVVLYEDKAKDSRLCSNTHISPWNCGCMESPVSIPLNSSQGPVQRLVRTIAEMSLLTINSEVNTPTHLLTGYICKKLTLRKVFKAHGYRLDNQTEQIIVQYGVKESPSVRFETLALIGSDRNKTNVLSLPGIIEEQSTYRGYEVDIKVEFTSRKDKYAGECEKLTRSLNIRAGYCVCEDLNRLKENYPRLAEALLRP